MYCEARRIVLSVFAAVSAVLLIEGLYAREAPSVVELKRTTITIGEGHVSPTFIQLPPNLKVQITASEIRPDQLNENKVNATGSTVITIPLDDGRSIIVSGSDIQLTKSLVKWSVEDRNDTLKELQAMRTKDQSVRLKFASFKVGSNELRGAREERISVDATNQRQLSSIIEKFGWPGLSFVGEEGSMAAFLVLDHADMPYREQYMRLVQEAVRMGEISPSLAATLEDRNLTEQGKKQIYGTQFSIDEKGGKGSMRPIGDPEGVNMRRKKVGLPPLDGHLVNIPVNSP